MKGWEMGFEPTTPGSTIQCSNQLSYTHRHGLITGPGPLTRTRPTCLKRVIPFLACGLLYSGCPRRGAPAVGGEREAAEHGSRPIGPTRWTREDPAAVGVAGRAGGPRRDDRRPGAAGSGRGRGVESVGRRRPAAVQQPGSVDLPRRDSRGRGRSAGIRTDPARGERREHRSCRSPPRPRHSSRSCCTTRSWRSSGPSRATS